MVPWDTVHVPVNVGHVTWTLIAVKIDTLMPLHELAKEAKRLDIKGRTNKKPFKTYTLFHPREKF